MEFVKRLGVSNVGKEQIEKPFVFEQFSPGSEGSSNFESSATNGSMASTEDLQGK